jgi:NAD(P)-dependent dehydrogenase (short-subunit alcohol dehydrogenase family)
LSEQRWVPGPQAFEQARVSGGTSHVDQAPPAHRCAPRPQVSLQGRDAPVEHASSPERAPQPAPASAAPANAPTVKVDPTLTAGLRGHCTSRPVPGNAQAPPPPMVRCAMPAARRVVITGASRGFGAALAAVFAERGDRVFAGTRGGASALAPLRERFPSTLTEIALDVSSDASVRRARAAIAEQVPAIDVLVNNAAIRSRTVMEPIESIDFADVATTLDVNAVGPLRVVQSFLPMLRRGASPLLVNVSSEAGSLADCRRERELDYCMSKAALNMATVILSNYLRGRVHVIAVHPGWLRTDMGGPHAALDPRETAEGVADLITREATAPAGPIFLDHEGRRMNW